MNLRQTTGTGHSAPSAKEHAGAPAVDRCLSLTVEGAALNMPEIDADAYRAFRANVKEKAMQMPDRLPAALKSRVAIVQQCRPEDLEGARRVYDRLGVKAELAPFYKDMPQLIARAHLVIARAGAGTVSELACIGRPAILVPLPHALDDNQTPNAEALVEAGGGWRLPQKDFTPEKLATMLTEAFNDPEGLAKHTAAALTLAKPDATCALADLVEQLEGTR